MKSKKEIHYDNLYKKKGDNNFLIKVVGIVLLIAALFVFWGNRFSENGNEAQNHSQPVVIFVEVTAVPSLSPTSDPCSVHNTVLLGTIAPHGSDEQQPADGTYCVTTAVPAPQDE